MIRRTALALALILTAAPAFAQAPATSLFVILYRAGPAWQAGKPMSAQGLGPHGAYIRRLMTEGKVVAGGPLDADAGMAIVRAANAEEVRAILASDPAITGGIFLADVRAWTLAVDSGKPLAR